MLVSGEEVALEQFKTFRNFVYTTLAFLFLIFGVFIVNQSKTLDQTEGSNEGKSDVTVLITILLPKLVILVIITTFIYSLSEMIVTLLGYFNI